MADAGASRCPQCGAALDSPLVCAACGRLVEPASEPTPFEVLGLPPEVCADERELEKRLLRLSRLVHPDFFATAGEAQRRLAEANTARLNHAFEILSDPFRRADWLIRARGGPADSGEREMPQEFLMEVLEWNEQLEEARAAGPRSTARADLPALAAGLRAERARRMGAVERLLAPHCAAGAPELVAARRELNAVRYLDRALRELEELRLEEAAAG